jgi:diguanylate cyclase (GGDEF)-like protein
MLFQFLLNRWAANLVSLIILVVVSGFSYLYLGPSVTLRVTVSLMLTFTFTSHFMNLMLKLQQGLEQHAIIDPLTGVYNRRRFDSDMERAIALRCESDIPSSLLHIDIDHFKAINDELGHAAGDLVLRDVVAIVRETIRQSDSLFRLGGEEFAVLMPIANSELAEKVAERVRAAVSNANLLDNRRVTISIGFDEFNLREDRSNLLHRCDVALYRAKDLGRNRVESGNTLLAQSA